METRDKYLQILRNACFGTRCDVHVEPAEVNELLRLCRIHGTGPLVYNELLKVPSCLTAQASMQMKQVCMQNMMLQGQWEQVIAKVWNAFKVHNAACKVQSEKVHAVLMKGFSYAQLYPLPYLRAWGDLDVWVGPEQYHKACGILREAFPEAKHHDEEWDELKHYCFVFDNGMAIELHRVSMDFLSKKDQAYWCVLEAEASQRAACIMQSAKCEVPVFEPKFDVLFCFMHSWEHFTGTGIPLKQVCDMALLVHAHRASAKCQVNAQRTSEELEAYLETHLKALGMLEVWQAYGYMACKAMGLNVAEWPLGVDSKYGERLYEQVMAEGQCRRKDYGEAADRYEAREHARQMNLVARKWLTLTQRMEKARFMHHFAPQYACNVLWQEVKKGIRRTIRREEMINY